MRRALITNAIVSNALALAALAGVAAIVPSAAGQTSPPTHRQDDGEVVRSPSFFRATAVRGREIVNANGEAVGTCSDFLFDRGTGRIDYVVLSNGGVLGFGSKQVAIPYTTFNYMAGENKLRLDVSRELIDRAAEFMPGEWIAIEGSDWRQAMRERHRDRVEATAADQRDPFAAAIQNAKEASVEGTIAAVHRDENAEGVEQVSVDVQQNDGLQRKVVLGPSWWVMSQASAPMRGAKIRVEGYELPRDADSRIVARSAVVNDQDLLLRTSKGLPRWDAADMATGSESDESASSPWVLFSDLFGLPAYARDERGGSIVDAICEVNSGQIAVLLLDPDENVLGIMDELRCVPWPIVGVGREAVRIDADRQMLLASQKPPENLSEWADAGGLERVYAPFNADVVEFHARPNTEWDQAETVGGWASDGQIALAIAGGQDVQVRGTIESVRSETLGGDTCEVTALDVRSGDHVQTVLIGPRWYMERQDLGLTRGQGVTIEAKRVTVNGETALVACRITRPNAPAITLWDGRDPVWDDR